MDRRAFLILLPGAVAACATKQVAAPPPEQLAAAKYVHGGPAAISLFTMINNRSGSGAHTSLMINAPSQRVIFDPAGTVRHPKITEINDVLYGITPALVDFYERAHARETYHVVIHRKLVPDAVGEEAIRRVQANGSTPSAMCANHSSRIISSLPGFETIRPTWLPKNLMQQYSALPGVTERKVFEQDADDKQIAIDAFKG